MDDFFEPNDAGKEPSSFVDRSRWDLDVRDIVLVLALLRNRALF